VAVTARRAAFLRRLGEALTTGIFAWISAHAADEAEHKGDGPNITPYWRTLKSGGELNPKHPGGFERSRVRLEGEGHQLVQRGSRWFVVGYQDRLAALAEAAEVSRARDGSG
jgi:hypothetical protein